MKRIMYLLTGLFFLSGTIDVNAQEVSKDCQIKYSLMSTDVKSKRYAEAKPNLEWLIQNCPKLSVNIYKYGFKVAKGLKDHDLAKKIYEARLANFPNKGVAKAHDNYAAYLIKNKIGTEDEIFAILEKTYNTNPNDMGVRNIYRYFEGIVKRYKDTDPQKVFDNYDNVTEAVAGKLENYQKKLSDLRKKEEAGTINAKDKKRLKAYTVNSEALGKVEGGLDAMLSGIATCDRLIPLLSKAFEEKQNDATWLRRSVSRLHNKDCKTTPLYEKLVLKYAEVAQTPDAYSFAAGVKDKKGDVSGAAKLRKKAFELETDPMKKARYKLMEAYDAGRGARARSLAYQALKYNPNMGKAYLFIASLYARSANACGNDVFEKKMVYVAALNKALKARKVDPGCGAGRAIANYRSNIPSKKDIFTKGVASGSSHKIGCWIGETVRVP